MSDLAEVLPQFRQRIVAAMARMQAHYAVTDILDGLRQRKVPRTGRLPDGLEFQFHGSGCRMWDAAGWVDFDFLPDHQVGFDAWKLYWFIDENGLIDPVPTRDKLEEMLVRAAGTDLVPADDGTGRYRFAQPL